MFLLREGVVIKQYFDDTLFFAYPNVCVGWISLERKRAINYRICQGLCRPYDIYSTIRHTPEL